VSSHYFFKDGFNIIIPSRRNLPSNLNCNVTHGLGNTSTDSQYQVLSKLFIGVRRQTLGIDWLGPPTMHAVYQRDGSALCAATDTKTKKYMLAVVSVETIQSAAHYGHGNTIMECHISATIAFTDTTLLHRTQARSKLSQR